MGIQYLCIQICGYSNIKWVLKICGQSKFVGYQKCGYTQCGYSKCVVTLNNLLVLKTEGM